MKLIILVATVLATSAASWVPIHEKYHGPLHYPKIQKGVPVEPAAVQHAREEHLKALSHASHKHEHHDYDQHHESGHKWHGPLHYPKIYKGVPVEPKEVQHAREAHLSALAHASHANHHHEHAHYDHHYEHDYDNHHEEEHQKKWHGPLHYPKIYNGVPIEPKEVQHARESHLNALAHASQDDHHYEHNHGDHYDGHYEEEHQKKWHGPLHYPKIYKGVPVEPKEVQHARKAHLNALSHASHQGYYDHHHSKTPKIGHDGKLQDTHEVELAKAKHFAAFHDALAQNTHHYRKRRGASSYVHFSKKVEHEVPIYQDKTMMTYGHAHNHQMYNHGNSHGYSYKQTHAPVYGHRENCNLEVPVYVHDEEYQLIKKIPISGQHHEYSVPIIGHDGTPVDTPEVQLAKEAHFAAHVAAELNYHH